MKQLLKTIPIIIFVIIMLTIPFLIDTKKVTLKEINTQIKPYINEETQKEQTLNNIYKNYNINKDLITEYTSYIPISFISVEEITIIKQENKEKQKIIKEKLNNYVIKKISTFEGYGPKQVEMLKDNIIEIKGDYIYLIISNDNKKIKQAIEALF